MALSVSVCKIVTSTAADHPSPCAAFHAPTARLSTAQRGLGMLNFFKGKLLRQNSSRKFSSDGQFGPVMSPGMDDVTRAGLGPAMSPGIKEARSHSALFTSPKRQARHQAKRVMLGVEPSSPPRKRSLPWSRSRRQMQLKRQHA